MTHHAPAAPVTTHTWDGTRDPQLAHWLTDTPHHWDGAQLVIHTPDGEIRPRPGWTLVRWPDGETTTASPPTAHRIYGPHGLTERLERAEAANARVRVLHRKASHGDTCVYCAHGQRLGYDTAWPCDTIRALDEPKEQTP